MDSSKPSNPAKSFKLVIILGFLALLAGGGAAGFILLSGKMEDESSFLGRARFVFTGHKKAVEKKGHGQMYKMEPFLVNLLEPGQLRYLKITLHLESDQEKPNEEYEKRLPQLRDGVLTILAGKSYKDIITAEGKAALREEIKARLNHQVTSFRVQNVYFSEFVVQ